MKIYLLRHAPRETPRDVADMADGDPEAELTPEGELIATAVGEWLVEHDEIPSAVYASDAVRTQQTAELVVKAIADGGFAAPEVQTDVSIGPHMSIRGLLLKLAEKGAKKVLFVTHREVIDMGLKAIDADTGNAKHADTFASGELRILDVKRKDGRWSERKRVRPSDLGFDDVY